MFECVVVGAVESRAAARAVRKAIEVTGGPDATLHLVLGTRRARLVPVTPDRRAWGTGRDPAESLLNEFRRMAAARSLQVRVHPLFVDPIEGLAKVAAAEGADLVVVGVAAAPDGRRFSALPKAVADISECPVLIV